MFEGSDVFIHDELSFGYGQQSSLGAILAPNMTSFDSAPSSNDLIGFEPFPASPTAEFDQTQIMGHGNIFEQAAGPMKRSER
jgi:hypothetical protein